MKSAHVNIPVFIPHLGCPNMCVFCNQRAISGVCSFIPEKARGTIDAVLETTQNSGKKREIAFFGGSFTGIDRKLMISLLDIAQEYVQSGQVSGIRMSTRPDYINDEIITILKQYTISAVELGIQSFSEHVLATCKRGHSAESSERAMTQLVETGFSTVGQMMIGLPGATQEDELYCAERIAALGADAARIYPTIVFRDTELHEMMKKGDYTPLTLHEAVERSAAVLDIFERKSVDCLRIGLCESENLHADETYVGGPNHPALGEMVYSALYYQRITEELDRITTFPSENCTIEVPMGDLSKAIGQKKWNRIRIEKEYPVKNVRFIENRSLTRYNIVLSFS